MKKIKIGFGEIGGQFPLTRALKQNDVARILFGCILFNSRNQEQCLRQNMLPCTSLPDTSIEN